MCNCQDTLIPQIGVVTDICTETADVKTFRVEKIGGGKLFEHLPGQCAILSVPGKYHRNRPVLILICWF